MVSFRCRRCNRGTWSKLPAPNGLCAECRAINPHEFKIVDGYYLEWYDERKRDKSGYYRLCLYDRRGFMQRVVGRMCFLWHANRDATVWYGGIFQYSQFETIEDAYAFALRQRNTLRDEIIERRYEPFPVRCTNCGQDTEESYLDFVYWRLCDNCDHAWMRMMDDVLPMIPGWPVCPVCIGEKTIQAVYEEWDDRLDNELCAAHKEVLDKMAERKAERMKQ